LRFRDLQEQIQLTERANTMPYISAALGLHSAYLLYFAFSRRRNLKSEKGERREGAGADRTGGIHASLIWSVGSHNVERGERKVTS